MKSRAFTAQQDNVPQSQTRREAIGSVLSMVLFGVGNLPREASVSYTHLTLPTKRIV